MSRKANYDQVKELSAVYQGSIVQCIALFSSLKKLHGPLPNDKQYHVDYNLQRACCHLNIAYDEIKKIIDRE